MPLPSAPSRRLSLGLAVVTAAAALATLSAPSGAAAAASDGPPAIVSLLRQTSPTAGGVGVRVYGSGLEGTTSVSVGGTPVPAFRVVDSTLLTLTTPPGAANSRGTIAITDNQGSTASADDNTRVLYTDGMLMVMPDRGLVSGSSVNFMVMDYVPSVGGVGLQLNPLAAFLENPPDWGGGPPPYAVPKVFGATNAAGAYTTNMTVDSPFVGSGQGPAYDPNVACPVTQDTADHGLRNCWLVFSQYGVGAVERPISFVTDPTPAPPTLVPSSSNVTVGQQISLSGLHWGANPYFGSDTTPADPGESRLVVELCDSAQLSCAPAPGSASVALTRYFDANSTAPGVQPRFSGAELGGSITVDNARGCAPSCFLRVRQERYDYPDSGPVGSFITATAPLVVSSSATTTTAPSSSTTTTTRPSSSTTTTTTLPLPPTRHPAADFAGDGSSDVSVFRPSSGTWFVRAASPEANAYGAQGDVAVPADYDGDGRTDRAVYRPEVGTWYVHNSTNDTDTLMNYGLSTDIAVPADYDGDGRADIAVFRPDSATWFIHQSSTNSDVIVSYGIPGDIPVVGDYDGDAKADVAVYRPSSGDWFVHKSSGGDTAVAYGGNPGDVPTPGDYDGDGRTDTAIYRPSVGTWYVHNSGANTDTLVNYGVGADQPQPGDYDGDGKTDLAVFRPGASTWYARNSSNGSDLIVTYGIGGDVPLPLPAAIRRFFY